jgi:hypothetical protein
LNFFSNKWRKSLKYVYSSPFAFVISFAATILEQNYLFSNDKTSNELLLELAEETR